MTPQVGQRVWADGLTGTYRIVALHTTRSLADLQLAGGLQTIEKHVPFGMIHALGEDFSQAASRIMRDAGASTQHRFPLWFSGFGQRHDPGVQGTSLSARGKRLAATFRNSAGGTGFASTWKS
jgi:hypothetical protein